MNATIARLSAQALFGRKRVLLLLVLPVALIALTITVRVLAGAEVGYDEIVVGLGLGMALPLVALLAASSVLGPEIDDGSIVYLLAKPISRRVVALSKFVVALGATVGFGALPILALGLINAPDSLDRSLAWLGGGVLAAVAYSGLFLALSASTRHAVVIGLLFVFFWEGLMGNLLTGIRWVSVGAWSRQLAASLDDTMVLASGVGTTYAVLACAVLTLGGVWFTGTRLRSFSMRGET
jgi:ABC-2 type transport system permease protein